MMLSLYRSLRHPATILFLLFLFPLQHADGQFLRLGPFDFDAKARLQGVYTTNVEGERPSEATASMVDYYVLAGLDLASRADVAPNTTLNLVTGIAMEKHFKRPDLDNSSNPFGRARLSSKSEIGHYTLTAGAGYEKQSSSADETSTSSGTSDSTDKVFVPGHRKTRDVYDTRDYELGLKWKRGAFMLSEDYDFSQERHDDPDFQDGDQDQTTWDFNAGLKLYSNLSVTYENLREKTVLINQPDSFDGYKTTETILLNWKLRLIERPSVTYSLGLQKQDDDNGKGAWEPVHILNAIDEWDLTPTLHLSASAVYQYEQKEEQNDISFTYNLKLDHQISATADESLSLTREPVSTLGSTTDTDTTTYGYQFRKSDLFIYNLNFKFHVTYEIDKPLDGGEDERLWIYRASLDYTRLVSRNLSRQLKYEYSREKSNLESELLEEHRVTLTYGYTF